MEILPYSDKYKEKVIKLVFDILDSEFGHRSTTGRPDLYNISEVYQTPNGNFWVAVEGDEVVGTIALKDSGEKEGCLKRLYIRKNLRRQGLGSKLLDVLLKFAKEKGYKRIVLSTYEDMDSANNFYVKKGFKKFTPPTEKVKNSSIDSVFYELKI